MGRDFPPVQTGPGAHPASCTMGTGSFPGIMYCRGVLLTTHPLLVPLSWKSRAIPLPTLWATSGPVAETLYLLLHYVYFLSDYTFIFIETILLVLRISLVFSFRATSLVSFFSCGHANTYNQLYTFSLELVPLQDYYAKVKCRIHRPDKQKLHSLCLLAIYVFSRRHNLDAVDMTLVFVSPYHL